MYVTLNETLCTSLYEEFERQHGTYATTEESPELKRLRDLMWEFRCAVTDSDSDDVEDLKAQIDDLEHELSEKQLRRRR